MIPDNTFSRLRSNSHGLLCPHLIWLDWDVEAAPALLYIPQLFLSPHLKRITFRTHYLRSGALRQELRLLPEVILCLPASLEHLSLACGSREGEHLKDAISSLVLRCGPSLRTFCAREPLSEAALHHLIQVPGIRHWTTIRGPPQIVPISIFLSLEGLRLEKRPAPAWLHLLASHEKGILQNGFASATPYTNIRETLKFLDCRECIIDSTLLSSVVEFRNLVALCMDACCWYTEGPCEFHLGDDDAENLAAAFPRLWTLKLGQPCHSGTCNTTVVSLMMISTRCLQLTPLEIHFNTLTITHDMQRLLDGGLGRDVPRCELDVVLVGFLPLELCEDGVRTVAKGFAAIFPCLEGLHVYRDQGSWQKVVSVYGRVCCGIRG